MRGEMVVSLYTFDAVLGGETIRIARGERVDAGHEAVRQYPRNFEPATGPPATGAPRSNGAGATIRTADRRPGRQPAMPRDEELRRRRERLREIADKAPNYGPGLCSAESERTREERIQEQFWNGVRDIIESPRERREARESEELLDALAAQRTDEMRREREAIGGWVDEADDA